MPPKTRKFEERALDDLVPYNRNVRLHPDKQLTQIAKSIEQFGFNNPVLIDQDNGIIAGHGRVAAARRLNLKKVPVIVLTHLSEEQKRAFIIADNKIADGAGWDDELVALELADLKELGVDLELTGFSEKELTSIFDLNEEKSDEEEKVHVEQAEAVTRPGDTWQLGKNRLVCKDGAGTVFDEMVGIWEKATGIKAILVATKQTFDEVTTERLYGGEETAA